MIEKNFDITFIAGLASKEKQIQQNYRPIIGVHKWFARRPGTLFRGLILSEFSDRPIKDTFYLSNNLSGLKIGDPFMGGGIPLVEANRVGCDILGYDINPMSYWIVKEEIKDLDLEEYTREADLLVNRLKKEIGHLYSTECDICGSDSAEVKYLLWVKVRECENCGNEFHLFPGYLIAADSRHPKNVFLCSACGELTEVDDRNTPGRCSHCSEKLVLEGPARRNHCQCPDCGTDNRYPVPEGGPPRHRLFAMEYICKDCKNGGHRGRFFKVPDERDIENVKEAEVRLAQMKMKYVPEDEILNGDESNRLLRWGYRHYREMFNARQLLGLEISARSISGVKSKRARNALATNMSDLLRYQNMLCRYDTRALKSLDIFSVHGFPVGLIQCESNFIGIRSSGRNACVGSGGWLNIIEKYKKAKSYCLHPFEIKRINRSKKTVFMQGENIGEGPASGPSGNERKVNLSCSDSASVDIPEASLDAVFTDPPYFANVQYAELMDFCYVWLRKLVGKDFPEFRRESTRDSNELTGNTDMHRDIEHFTEGLSSVYQKMSKALKPGSPMAFTYHHNKLEAYYPVAVSILDAGLTCSASLPCPAEMGASIHINGTGSSVIDTVFVCRKTGTVRKDWLADNMEGLVKVVEMDMDSLASADIMLTEGDVRCIFYGHLIRLAIWDLRAEWSREDTCKSRLNKIDDWVRNFGEWEEAKVLIGPKRTIKTAELPLFSRKREEENVGVEDAKVSF